MLDFFVSFCSDAAGPALAGAKRKEKKRKQESRLHLPTNN
jgi:hypothetical protein